ncbi:AN1-type zinc finger protein 4 isoform X2 [Ornithorhynchus anatinus]|uniref:AN1-type zinc finger protein 4 isoform X2 n=1 Tax=Ornithorhynchus anatinus TaxID=9258 RepID=UPI0010A8FB49|nr:AN1-type zinc finger protein 4 isoform X2 [Ornithorhynchus anatinus]
MFRAASARTGVQLPTSFLQRIGKAAIMANKKEPPFFNEDNVGPLYYKFPFYETMDLFIETLTGTCFELQVSPFETVISVKAKIQRLEGIPICQQHLIWNNVELEDDYCLNDYNISEGCTLKLVLAMRGGPINTKRVPMEDPLREMAEFMYPGQDEIWEKAPSNKQVTFLVYREGDQLSFFRVVDRGDGTLTPISESISGGSIYNLYTDEEEEMEPSPSGQQIIENSITMNKMKLLKAKMEHMNLSKKPKKAIKVKPRPPLTPRPSSGSVAAARHRLLRVLPHIGQSCLPLGNSYPSEPSHSALSGPAPLATAGTAASSVTGDLLQEENRESPPVTRSVSSAALRPRVSRIELEEATASADAVLPLTFPLLLQAQTLSEKVGSGIEREVVLLHSLELCAPEDLPLPEADAAAPFLEGGLPQRSGERAKANPNSLLPTRNRGPKATEQPPRIPIRETPSCEAVEAGVLNTRALSAQKNGLLSPLRCSPPTAPSSPCPNPQRRAKCLEPGHRRPSTSQNPLRLREARTGPEPPFPRTTRLRSVKVDPLGKRPDVISKGEARGMTETANKASREPVGSVRDLGFLASLARSTSRDSLQAAGGLGRLRPSGVLLPTSLQPFQEKCSRRTSPQIETADFILSSYGLGMNGNSTAAGKRVGEATHHLPPVKAPVQTKKKTAKHCFLCGKKTGLATSYECRCGNNFCASHRYAEAHGCTFDYKGTGRRYLQEANPVVSAPKLPKI